MAESNVNEVKSIVESDLPQKEKLDKLRTLYDEGKISFMDYQKEVKTIMRGSFK